MVLGSRIIFSGVSDYSGNFNPAVKFKYYKSWTEYDSEREYYYDLETEEISGIRVYTQTELYEYVLVKSKDMIYLDLYKKYCQCDYCNASWWNPVKKITLAHICYVFGCMKSNPTEEVKSKTRDYLRRKKILPIIFPGEYSR